MTAAEYAHEGGFPTFTPLFESAEAEGAPVALYLPLLKSPARSDAQLANKKARTAVASSPDPDAEVIALFAGADWRPHIVAAVVLLAERRMATPATVAALWGAFDSASWVSPQLAVIAFRCDPDFKTQARRRIEAGSPANMERFEALVRPENRGAAGPLRSDHHSGKALAALVALCRTLPSTAPWLDAALERPEIHGVLEADYDGGDRIAVGWRDAVEQVFAV